MILTVDGKAIATRKMTAGGLHVFSELPGFLGDMTRRLVAIVVCLTPRRHWARFDALPLSNMVAVSAVLTLLAGGILGASGYLAHMRAATNATVDAGLKVAARQIGSNVSPDKELTLSALNAASALSFVGFALFTPIGLVSIYLVFSGCLRLASFVVDEPFGDPLATGIDALAHRATSAARRKRRRRRRERQEGREVPDRLVTGAWAGVPDADCVVVASRRKPDWTAGTFVVTRDVWYRLGQPFDLQLPDGLRTAYPLTALQTTEVLRRAVRYELPPLEILPGRAGRSG